MKLWPAKREVLLQPGGMQQGGRRVKGLEDRLRDVGLYGTCTTRFSNPLLALFEI